MLLPTLFGDLIYRYTADGRRVFTFGIFRRRTYHIADAEVPGLEHRLWVCRHAAWIVMAASAIPAAIADVNWLWIGIPAAIALNAVGGWWIVRGLSKVPASGLDLQPIDGAEQKRAIAELLGRPALWLSLGSMVVMGGLGLALGIATGDWLGWLAFGLGAVGAGFLVRSLRRLRGSS